MPVSCHKINEAPIVPMPYVVVATVWKACVGSDGYPYYYVTTLVELIPFHLN